MNCLPQELVKEILPMFTSLEYCIAILTKKIDKIDFNREHTFNSVKTKKKKTKID